MRQAVSKFAQALGAMVVLSSCTPLLRLVPISTVSGLAGQGTSIDPEKPLRDPALNLYATVLPLMVRNYDAPAKVAACLTRWSNPASRDTLDVLLALGTTRELLFSPADRMRDETLCASSMVASLSPLFDCSKAPPGADFSKRLQCDQLSDTDRRLLSLALLQLGDALHGQFSSMWPTGTGAPPDYARGFQVALLATAGVLERTPPSVARDADRQRPVLALSGGAANGAFTAGFLYRLFSLREQARAAYLARGDLAAVKDLDEHERFDAVVSTSVGSLLAPATDLYFDDARAAGGANAPTAEDRQAFTSCLQTSRPPGTAPPDRLAQACALQLMRHYFTHSNEWDLLCTESGTLAGLLGTDGTYLDEQRANFAAFDPMRDRVIHALYDAFSRRMLTNDVQVEVMSVDVKQRVTMALDERACTGGAPLARDPASVECLVSNTTASLVEPVLARDVTAVFTGLSSYQGPGERGQWLDGGLRSGSPVLRALQLTRWPLVTPRFDSLLGTMVLSVSTHRSEETPTTRRATLPALAFDTVGNFADQIRLWELGSVGAFAQVQWQEMEAWRRAPVSTLRPTTRGSLAYPVASPAGGLVDSVVVPENIEWGKPVEQATASEYTFDPVTMTRLFLLGERSLLEAEPLFRLERLGWARVTAWLGESANGRTNLKAAQLELAQRVARSQSAYDVDAYAQKREDGAANCMTTCQRNGGKPKAAPDPACSVDLLPAPLAGARPGWPW
jgi:hypothetical protein